MRVSAEIRWFWPTSPPAGLEEWFRDDGIHEGPAWGGWTRTDEYPLSPGQAELGVKRRARKGALELKGLVAISEERLAAGPFDGRIELWAKWLSGLEVTAPMRVDVEKRRWSRTF